MIHLGLSEKADSLLHWIVKANYGSLITEHQGVRRFMFLTQILLKQGLALFLMVWMIPEILFHFKIPVGLQTLAIRFLW